MKKFVLAIVMLSVLGSLAACLGEVPATNSMGPVTEEPYSPTFSPKPDWLVQWLNAPVCQPPCWENITLGKTSFKDALVIAKGISDFEETYANDEFIHLDFNQNGTYYFAILQSRGDVNIQEIDLNTKYTTFE